MNRPRTEAFQERASQSASVQAKSAEAVYILIALTEMTGDYLLGRAQLGHSIKHCLLFQDYIDTLDYDLFGAGGET